MSRSTNTTDSALTLTSSFHLFELFDMVRDTDMSAKAKLIRMTDFGGVGLQWLNRFTPGLTGITGLTGFMLTLQFLANGARYGIEC